MDPANLRFARTHECIAVSDHVGTIGVSDFAVKLLTDIVFLELPKVGRQVRQGDSIGEIESVKAVSDLYAPCDGEIIEVNQSLPDNLALLSDSPFEKAWIAKIRVTRPEQVPQLLDYPSYLEHCRVEEH